jgi:hypothetical protein
MTLSASPPMSTVVPGGSPIRRPMTATSARSGGISLLKRLKRTGDNLA